MEVDELPDFSAVCNVQSIETGVQSMEISNEAEISDVLSATKTDDSESFPIRELNECEKAMLQFQKEREETFSRTCLFCKQHFIGKRSLILDHLSEQHHLFLGQSDNLVYVNEFLDILENMLKKLQCIYCEKFFKDWPALKEHMRKKIHKRINPYNKTFDKFYMSNYLNMFDTVNSVSQDAEEEREILIGPKEDTIVCLFCDNKFPDFDGVINHLETAHEFDFKKIKSLTFYEQVKLINYIRQKVLEKECPICETIFKNKDSLGHHMTFSRHIRLLPKRDKWDRPEYFFPTLETDYFLCALPVDEEDFDDEINHDDATVKIISEEIMLPKSSVLIDENLRKELL